MQRRRLGSIRYRFEALHSFAAAPEELVRPLTGQNRGNMIVDLTGYT
ncbi:hypothetical protein [Nocardia fusca]|uniref:Uncharacterized protein n=1 Tax=Nocardia fusca TaxID=941183 RepID=A0ABV3FGQ2_9NOCA